MIFTVYQSPLYEHAVGGEPTLMCVGSQVDYCVRLHEPFSFGGHFWSAWGTRRWFRPRIKLVCVGCGQVRDLPAPWLWSRRQRLTAEIQTRAEKRHGLSVATLRFSLTKEPLQ